MLDEWFRKLRGGRVLNEHRSELSLPPEAAAPGGHARADGADALSEPALAEVETSPTDPSADEGAPPQPVMESPVPPAAPTAGAPGSQDGAPVLQDFPVASVLPPLAPLIAPPPALTPLEDRIRRLEAELARLRTAPVAEPLGSAQPTTGIARQRGRFWDNLGERLLAPSGPAARDASLPSVARDLVPAGVRRTWTLWEVLTELRAMYCMFFDPRYRLSWFGRLAPLILVGLIVSSWIWVPFHDITAVGWILVKIADVVLAYILFKVLSYEARRYRETAPDLPPSMRL
jgi:hypothetical protein